MPDKTIKNGKKALECAKEFLHADSPYYPLGTGESHLLKFILDKIHEDSKAPTPKKNYKFPGYIGFILLGCPVIFERNICLKEFTEGHLEVPKKLRDVRWNLTKKK